MQYLENCSLIFLISAKLFVLRRYKRRVVKVISFCDRPIVFFYFTCHLVVELKTFAGPPGRHCATLSRDGH